MKVTGSWGVALLGLFLIGCRTREHHVHHIRYVEHGGKEVVIATGHVHTASCGHFRYGDRWFYAPHHRHGVDCGHTTNRGMWILEER